MTHNLIAREFVVPTAIATALAIMLSIGAVYLTEKHFVPAVQAEADHSAGNGGIVVSPSPDGRLSRVRLLLSRW
jgi:hypothetical protein